MIFSRLQSLESLQPDVVLSCLRSSKLVIHEVLLGPGKLIPMPQLVSFSRRPLKKVYRLATTLQMLIQKLLVWLRFQPSLKASVNPLHHRIHFRPIQRPCPRPTRSLLTSLRRLSRIQPRLSESLRLLLSLVLPLHHVCSPSSTSRVLYTNCKFTCLFFNPFPDPYLFAPQRPMVQLVSLFLGALGISH